MDYKEEIKNTRRGCVGGSDGKMLAQISLLGNVPKSAYKRLAIVKGILQQGEDDITTKAMLFGDFIENQIYASLAINDDGWESNPLWVSSKYSQDNVSLICHPDIIRLDKEKETLYVYECKATQMGFDETKHAYKQQMYIEHTLAREIASGLGKRFKVKLYLVHYDTNGVDLDGEWVYDVDRMTVKEVRFPTPVFDIQKAMTIINDFLVDYTFYSDDDEIDSEYLPERIRAEFDTITNVISEIKAREERVDDFKKRLYAFMCEKNVKSIKNDTWSITRVDATESVSFDYKRFLEDYERKYPRKAKKLVKDYEKRSKRNGYVNIKLRKQ